MSGATGGPMQRRRACEGAASYHVLAAGLSAEGKELAAGEQKSQDC